MAIIVGAMEKLFPPQILYYSSLMSWLNDLLKAISPTSIDEEGLSSAQARSKEIILLFRFFSLSMFSHTLLLRQPRFAADF